MQRYACLHCGEPISEPDGWCPHCGFREVPGREERWLLRNPVSDIALGVFAALLPGILLMAMSWFYLSPFSGICGLLAPVTLIGLLGGFFTFLRPYRRLRLALAWTGLIYSLPLAFMAGCIAITGRANDPLTAIVAGFAGVAILALQAFLIRTAERG